MLKGQSGRLTPKQVVFLGQLIRYQASQGVPPTVREMQELGGFRSPRSVTQFLDALERAGYIQRTSGARNVRVVRRPSMSPVPDRVDTVRVPLVGRVAAGRPILAAHNVETYISVSTRLARGHWRYFLLRVHGDSMDRAGIRDGDLALVRQQPSAQPGEHVVALIDDEATIKRLRVARDAIILEPVSSNPANKPIVVDRDFLIQGVVVAAIPTEAT
jgi:repressor LexA